MPHVQVNAAFHIVYKSSVKFPHTKLETCAGPVPRSPGPKYGPLALLDISREDSDHDGRNPSTRLVSERSRTGVALRRCKPQTQNRRFFNAEELLRLQKGEEPGSVGPPRLARGVHLHGGHALLERVHHHHATLRRACTTLECQNYVIIMHNDVNLRGQPHVAAPLPGDVLYRERAGARQRKL